MTVYKMVEVVGTSNTSITDAIRGAVHRAGETLEDLSWFEVKEIRGRLLEGEIAEFQVKVEIGFKLHAAGTRTGDLAKEGTREASSPEARSVAAQVARKTGERGRDDLARGFEDQPGGGRR